jgi:hypothetical protein
MESSSTYSINSNSQLLAIGTAVCRFPEKEISETSEQECTATSQLDIYTTTTYNRKIKW